MRLQIVPGSLSEALSLATGKVPLPVLDTLLPLVKPRALMAGERLGVFEPLREGLLSAAAPAGRLGLDADSLAPWGSGRGARSAGRSPHYACPSTRERADTMVLR